MAEAEALVEGYVSPLVSRIQAIRDRIVANAEERAWVIDRDRLDDRRIVRRMVLKRCVYGVDKNPMEVELVKVALWLRTFTVGAPLSFLDHHLRCGDSLFRRMGTGRGRQGDRVWQPVASARLCHPGGTCRAGSFAAPTAAACGRRRCTPSSAPPSSTMSIRRPGSPMPSAASPGRRRPGSTNSFRGTGKTTGGTIRLHRPRPPPGASSPAIPRRHTQPKIPRGPRRMVTVNRRRRITYTSLELTKLGRFGRRKINLEKQSLRVIYTARL